MTPISVKFGLFNYAAKNTGGCADFDYFHINDEISDRSKQ